MQHIISLDPRIMREHIPAEFNTPLAPKGELDQLQSYEVFQQGKSGGRYTHVGSVRASTHELALVFAKEIYGRRGPTFGLWVVQTDNIHPLAPDDIDVFETTTSTDKDYREVVAYARVRDKIETFKKSEQSA